LLLRSLEQKAVTGITTLLLLLIIRLRQRSQHPSSPTKYNPQNMEASPRQSVNAGTSPSNLCATSMSPTLPPLHMRLSWRWASARNLVKTIACRAHQREACRYTSRHPSLRCDALKVDRRVSTQVKRNRHGGNNGASSGLSTGALIGIIISAFVVLGLVIGLFLYRRRQKHIEIREAEMEKER
ncbi:MAG: hypothetical protein JOS17DRAFT_832944, partial [Linnemannia elongata]